MEILRDSQSLNRAIILLLLITSSMISGCPPKCKCSRYKYKCQHAGLKEVPKDIPLKVVSIDLSYNPFMHVRKDAFVHFSQLNTLKLNNCSLKDPFAFPRSLGRLELKNNLVNLEALKTMFNNQLLSLDTLYLNSNQLNLNEVFPILPKGIKELSVSENHLATLKRDNLECFTGLRMFVCEKCSLQRIQPNAFEYTNDIHEIGLSFNNLTDLPDDVFKLCTKLQKLKLRGNSLKNFNASKVHVRRLLTLELGYNKIEEIDLRFATILDIGLEGNKIKKIGADIFERSYYIHQLGLQGNMISSISAKAFEKVRFVAELLLHDNKLESVPAHAFNNTEINKMFLHKNKLSNVEGFIYGMKKPPNIITLFSNVQLQQLNMSNFDRMTKDSEIYISCKDLKRIISSSKLKASIKCCPDTDLVFRSPMRFFAFMGYECKWHGEYMEFVCRACSAGYYCDSDAREESRGKCRACPPGSFYQDDLASTNCKSCPVGQYVPPERSPGKDVSDCRTCPKGTDTNSLAGTRACNCLDGFYRKYRFGACEKCGQNGYECSRDYPQLKKGYWMTWNGTESSNRNCMEDFKAFISNLETHGNDYDRNTMKFNCRLPLPIKCPILHACNGGINASCSPGYAGVLCALCSKGYSRQFNRCIKCPQVYIVILEFIGYLVLFILLCVVISLTDKISVGQSSDDRKGDANSRRTFADIIIASFKILIGFYQVLLSVLHTFSNIHWPKTLLKTVSVLDYIQFEIIRIPSLRCINQNWNIDSIKEFWLALIITVSILMLSFAYFVMKICCLYLLETDSVKFKTKRNRCGKKCIKFVALFLFVTYPFTSTRIIQVLPISCTSLCTAERGGKCLHTLFYLRSDLSIPCPTITTHRYTLIAAYCSLVIPFGLPIALWVILLRYVHRARNQKGIGKSECIVPASDTVSIIEADTTSQDATGVAEMPGGCDRAVFGSLQEDDAPVVISALRFTYENYEDDWWFWEIIEMIRKLLLTVGTVLFLQHTKVGLSSAIVLAMSFAVLHARAKPIKDKFENFVQLLSLFIVSINLCIGAVIQSDVNNDPGTTVGHSESRWLGIFLIVMNSFLVVLLLARFIKVLVKKIVAFKKKKNK